MESTAKRKADLRVLYDEGDITFDEYEESMDAIHLEKCD